MEESTSRQVQIKPSIADGDWWANGQNVWAELGIIAEMKVRQRMEGRGKLVTVVSSEMAHAHARLFAAAPKLLAEIKARRRHLADTEIDPDDSKNVLVIEEAQRLHKLIALAEGGAA